MHELSDFFRGEALLRNGTFATLGSGRNEWGGTLAFADTAPYLRKLIGSERIDCILTRRDLADTIPARFGVAVDDEPRVAFYRLHEEFLQRGCYGKLEKGLRGEGCRIHPSAVISDYAVLGDGVIVNERVVIRGGVELGDGCVIEPGVVLGAEGILYRWNEGRIRFIPHAGRVVMGTGVVCLSTAVVVRSVHPGFPTRVGDRSLVGIGATVGHEAQVGCDCVISGQCVVARGSTVETGSFIGPGAIVTENLQIGEGARVLAGSVVIRDVGAGEEVSGNFALSHSRRLAEYVKKESK